MALARAGIACDLYEMRPVSTTAAHVTGNLAELVCSNSLRSSNPTNAVGLLKQEMAALGSIVMAAAMETRIPAGDALAVDRELFSRAVTARITAESGIRLHREEVRDLPDDRPAIAATGPLTSEALSRRIAEITGAGHLYFYDAIAPVVSDDSLDHSAMFLQSRYDKGGGNDYLNCPMDEPAYRAFVAVLLGAGKVQARDFEKDIHFSGCMPLEVIAASGPDAWRMARSNPSGSPIPRPGSVPSPWFSSGGDRRRGGLEPGGLPDEADIRGAEEGLQDDPRARVGRVPEVRLGAPQHFHRLSGASGRQAEDEEPARPPLRRTDHRGGGIRGIIRLRYPGRTVPLR